MKHLSPAPKVTQDVFSILINYAKADKLLIILNPKMNKNSQTIAH